MPLDPSHPDYWTEALQFTSNIHRDVYPAIDPSNPRIQQIARDKVVLITGAGSGFGEGAAKQWVKAKASAILIASRTQENLDTVSESLLSISSTTKILQVVADMSSQADVHRLFEKAIETFGRVDVVVHCAGVLGPLANIGDTVVHEWWSAFEINVKGCLLVVRELVRVAAGREATFINAGSAAAYFANPQQSPYTSSKLAITMILDQVHTEYPNVRVFNVHPGMAVSKILRPELHIYAKDTIELFGSVAIYLSGPQADFLRGRFIAANWDVNDLEKHREEIVAQELLKGQAFKGNIGPGGHFAGMLNL
ncbi:Short chain dehydrogenase citE-like protein [Cladobotryum mycophilum]|uniref:Short chain dehydrogenase citE-like protein n=1 Tax=Cladobotryum mycophilum TaxID=491253 RepID=A0ABR0SIB2_9HYPO